MVIQDAHARFAPGWQEADYVGGHPALDFLNTVADTGKTRLDDKLTSWQAVRSWASGSGLLSDLELDAFAQDDRLDDEAGLASLRRLREEAYTVLLGLAQGGGADGQAMAVLERSIRGAIGRGAFRGEGRGLRWRPDSGMPERWLDAVALAFEDLMRSDDVARLRQCGRCTWLFIDRGRGAGRRWCDMRTCGNRAKAEAYRCR
ncbi:CGNR zinc finger domain-containing protein [Labrys neptuniae]